MKTGLTRYWLLLATTAVLLPLTSVRADSSSQNGGNGCPVVNYFENWFDRATRIQSEQPHWVTPLATVTPRLEQEIRYDQTWQSLPGGHTLYNYGSSKGLELIPADPIEIIIGVPGYQEEFAKPHKYGWADEPFLLKYRILSANEKEGDYILTAFMGLSVPSGSSAFTSHYFMFTPTIAGGKGWGDFSVQSTLGVSVPGGDGQQRSGPGTALISNTALQYHVMKYFWPEVEANYTWWRTASTRD